MKCDSPYLVKTDAPQPVPVPCGRCPPCKIRRVNSWVFRLMQEEKRSLSAYFITLTYDTNHVPISENGFMTLKKSDFQDYMKRLRKLCHEYWLTRYGGESIGYDLSKANSLKYYAVGEYGTNNHRPHFHAIIFNVPDSEMFAKAWSLDGKQFGTVDVGTCTSDSVAYCMKYIDKSNFQRQFRRDDRVPEFPLMSKGIGSNYVTPAIIRYHRADITRLFATKEGGYKIALPKYYRDRIYSEADKKEQVSLIQEIVFEEDEKQRSVFTGDNWYAAKLSEKEARHHKFYSRLKNRKL